MGRLSKFLPGAAVALLAASAASASPTQIKVTIENLAPDGGVWNAPLWVGFNDGTFVTATLGQPASDAIQHLAEDGTPAFLSADFTTAGVGAAQGVITGEGVPGHPEAPPVIGPGKTASMIFTVDSTDPMARYLSYAGMVVPSNDAFITSLSPHQIFDASGNFLGGVFMVSGQDILDAGTEVNTELPADTAFLGQAAPNTGPDQNGVVAIHPGYLGSVANPGTPSILGATSPIGVTFDATGADFKTPGYQLARISVTAVPEPMTGLLLLAGSGLMMLRRRRSA